MSADKRKDLLGELSDGIKLAFENAESLFHEGALPRNNRYFVRAYLCHQISGRLAEHKARSATPVTRSSARADILTQVGFRILAAGTRIDRQ
jgi:hypothetical protein